VVERLCCAEKTKKLQVMWCTPVLQDAILGSGGPGLINFFDTLCAAAIYLLHLSEGLKLLKG
jgi:hypothetical protein